MSRGQNVVGTKCREPSPSWAKVLRQAKTHIFTIFHPICTILTLFSLNFSSRPHFSYLYCHFYAFKAGFDKFVRLG